MPKQANTLKTLFFTLHLWNKQTSNLYVMPFIVKLRSRSRSGECHVRVRKVRDRMGWYDSSRVRGGQDFKVDFKADIKGDYRWDIKEYFREFKVV